MKVHQERLYRICSVRTSSGGWEVPKLPEPVIMALCQAQSVDGEIEALVCDLSVRDRDLVLSRWGAVDEQIPTLDDIGRKYGITRERARQITRRRDDLVRCSGVRLPLASAAVCDLDEAGGALPDADYSVLLKHSPVPVSRMAIRTLEALAELNCVSAIHYDRTFDLWVTENGATRWIDSGTAARLRTVARTTSRPFFRRIGALPLHVVDRLSPFGREHALYLMGAPGACFEVVDDHVVIPGADSAILRQCRKTIAAVGSLELTGLFQGIMRAGYRDLDEVLFARLLAASGDFIVRDCVVGFRHEIDPTTILSPAELTGFGLLRANGNAMLWWDFVEAMVEAGFSGAMASVVLRKPAVRALGPAMYGLRGQPVSDDRVRRLRRRRSLMARGASPIVREELSSSIVTVVDLVLNRFAMQGVLPAPPQLRDAPRVWIATLPNGDEVKIQVRKGFIWPVGTFLRYLAAGPGDTIRARFDRNHCRVSFELVQAASAVPLRRGPRTREDQIVEALFGSEFRTEF